MPDTSQFTTVYDYFDFRVSSYGRDRYDVTSIYILIYCEFKKSILILKTLKTPGTIYCQDRKLTDKKPPSKIPNSFSYSEELFVGGTVSYIRNLFYDEARQLVRYETRDRFQSIFDNETEPIRFSREPIIIINDFNIGVSYSMNRNTGFCRIGQIRSSSIDLDQEYTESLLNSADGNYAIRLRSAKSLLNLDSDYLFTGTRRVNGISSDIFISKKIVANKDFINEYAFPSVNKK